MPVGALRQPSVALSLPIQTTSDATGSRDIPVADQNPTREAPIPLPQSAPASSKSSPLLRAALFATALLLPACKPAAPSPVASPPSTTFPLNQLPTPQLRAFLKGYPGDWRTDSDRAQQRPEPPAEKPLPPNARLISLTPPAEFPVTLGQLSVRDAIATRRSTREFSPTPLTLPELSFLLWSTQGITAAQPATADQPAQSFRAAPSAGARYPLETYLAIYRVEGLSPGLYCYLPSKHALVLLREDPALASNLQRACYSQSLISAAPVVFLWSAVPYRTEWKYTYISHRMIAMEAGHVCENLYLAATASGLGACALESYHQPAVDQLLGLDGEDEFAIYIAAVGRPSSAPSNLPKEPALSP